MTADILAVVGAGTTALALAAIIYLVYALRDATTDQRAALASESLAVQGRMVAEAARDGYKAQAVKSDAEAQEARAQLVAAQAAANAARKELETRVAKEIVAANPGDAARIVDELLASPLVSAPSGTAGPAAANLGFAGQAAVLATAAAISDDPRRRP